MQVIDSLIKYTWDFFMGSADVYTLCIMHRSRLGPGNELHQNKAARSRFAF